MAVNAYPSSLPGPAVGPVTPAERRFATQGVGPLSLRSAQLDYLGTQQLQWAILTAAQALTFYEWWRDTLFNGGAWFTANWPHTLSGLSQTIHRRFASELSWKHIPGGSWSVSALVQLRGSAAPLAEPALLDTHTVLLMHMDRVIGGQILYDQCGHDGFIDEISVPLLPPQGQIVTGAGMSGVGALYLPPYGPSPPTLISWGVVPAFPQLGISGAFTIEFSHIPGDYAAFSSTFGMLCLHQIPALPSGLWQIVKTSSDLVFNLTETGVDINLAANVSFSGRMDIAVSRDDAGIVRLFLNGTKIDESVVVSTSTLVSSRTIGIGTSHPDNAALSNDFADGYYDEIRISDVCRYTSDYTPHFLFPNP